MPDSEPDFERFWERLRGPRPKVEPEAEVHPPSRMEQHRLDMEKAMGGNLWASVIMVVDDHDLYGPRIRVAEKGPVEDGACDLKIQFPQSTTEYRARGIAVWESPTAIQALAISDFTTGTNTVYPGDTLQIQVRIKVG